MCAIVAACLFEFSEHLSNLDLMIWYFKACGMLVIG